MFITIDVILLVMWNPHMINVPRILYNIRFVFNL